VVGGVCLLLPFAGWALLASRTGDQMAALATVGQAIAILRLANLRERTAGLSEQRRVQRVSGRSTTRTWTRFADG
jgi:uncharacterized membrane protein